MQHCEAAVSSDDTGFIGIYGKERKTMHRKFRLSIALDIDDLLMECIPYAIELANEKYKFDPPLSIYEVDRWGKLGTRADVIFEFYQNPDLTSGSV